MMTYKEAEIQFHALTPALYMNESSFLHKSNCKVVPVLN